MFGYGINNGFGAGNYYNPYNAGMNNPYQHNLGGQLNEHRVSSINSYTGPVKDETATKIIGLGTAAIVLGAFAMLAKRKGAKEIEGVINKVRKNVKKPNFSKEQIIKRAKAIKQAAKKAKDSAEQALKQQATAEKEALKNINKCNRQKIAKMNAAEAAAKAEQEAKPVTNVVNQNQEAKRPNIFKRAINSIVEKNTTRKEAKKVAKKEKEVLENINKCNRQKLAKMNAAEKVEVKPVQETISGSSTSKNLKLEDATNAADTKIITPADVTKPNRTRVITLEEIAQANAGKVITLEEIAQANAGKVITLDEIAKADVKEIIKPVVAEKTLVEAKKVMNSETVLKQVPETRVQQKINKSKNKTNGQIRQAEREFATGVKKGQHTEPKITQNDMIKYSQGVAYQAPTVEQAATIKTINSSTNKAKAQSKQIGNNLSTETVSALEKLKQKLQIDENVDKILGA